MSDRIEMAGGRGEDQFTTDSFKGENSVQRIYSLEDNGKLTQFYTRMPSYDSFMAFSSYLESKAVHLQAWRGNDTSDSRSRESSMDRKPYHYFSSLSMCNQLFAVLIRLRWLLEPLDACTRFKINVATYSRMFTT